MQPALEAAPISLHAACSGRWMGLRPDGTYHSLASYLGRVSFMQDRTLRRLLSPGQPRTLEFQSQTVTSRLLAAGSRIVAVIGVPKLPDTQINYGTGRDVSSESISDAKVPLCIQWLDDSYLELGIRGIFQDHQQRP